MDKFEKMYRTIINEINYMHFDPPFICKRLGQDYMYYKEESFLQLYKALICEEYTIFPVPRKLMNDMLDYSLNNKSLNEKVYTCKDILETYIIDWKYYNQFKENIKLMMKNNKNCSITLVLYDNFKDGLKIFKKYKNDDIKNEFINHFKNTNKLDEGIIYTYGNGFDVCLVINCSIKDKFILAKTIQHELIHWMQFSLNSETGKTYGKFKEQKLNLDLFDLSLLSDLGVNKDYLLSEYEFEPWVANTVEEFSQSSLKVNEYKNIIENQHLFIDAINHTKNQGEYEMFVFGMVCYIASKRKYESYWYYLIEAMKEN